jgi:hypothetical protein
MAFKSRKTLSTIFDKKGAQAKTARDVMKKWADALAGLTLKEGSQSAYTQSRTAKVGVEGGNVIYRFAYGSQKWELEDELSGTNIQTHMKATIQLLYEGKLSSSLISELESLMKVEQSKILAARSGKGSVTPADETTKGIFKKK